MDQEKKYEDLSDASVDLIAETAAKILLSKKAKALKMYRVTDTTVITDYHLIVTGRSSTHIKALADELAEEMGKHGVRCAHMEGHDGAAWILVDFGCLIAHVFDRTSREYYNLERLMRAEDEVDCTELENEEKQDADQDENV